jgi:hypothetical protein
MSAHEDYLRRNVLEQDPAILREAEIQVFFEDDENLPIQSNKSGGALPPSAPDARQAAYDDWPEPEPLGGEFTSVLGPGPGRRSLLARTLPRVGFAVLEAVLNLA